MHWYDVIQGVRRRVLRRLLARRFGALGARSTFDPLTSSIAGYANLYIGDDVFIGRHAVISADSVSIVIGDDTIIGAGFYVMAGDHRFDVAGQPFRGAGRGANEAVSIGRNVWIGARVTVLKGVTIGDGAIIGAGSVVVHDVPPLKVAVGSPAQVVRDRFRDQERQRHLAFIECNLRMPSVGRRD